MSSLAKVVSSVGIAVFVLAGLDVPSASAQGTRETGPTPAVDSGATRFGFGIGGGSMGGGGEGITVRLGYTISKFDTRSALITIRSATVQEFDLFGPSPAESVWDIGVLYGRQTRGKWGYASASAGLAMVGGMRRGERISPPTNCDGYSLIGGLACAFESAFTPVEYARRPFYTAGIPVELEAGFNFSSRIGLGVSFFANVNPERTLTGASLSVVVGKLR